MRAAKTENNKLSCVIKTAITRHEPAWVSWRSWSSWGLNPNLDYVPHVLQNTGKPPSELTWPNSSRITVSCLRWPDLAPVWPEVWMTWMIEQMAQEPRAPWYLSTHVARLAKWHVEPWEQQKGCGISRWLRNHQIAAESAESCGMPVNMSKSKQNSHTLAKLTWSCLMTSNVMIWVVLHWKWGKRER